jgi:hypothetical protein
MQHARLKTQHARLNRADVTPEYEDAGLFGEGVCQVDVAIVPLIRRNRRSDVVVTGFAGEGRQMTVLFAGRRAADAAPALAQLKKLGADMRKAAAIRKQPAPRIEDIRLPMRIEGTWRKLIQTDDTGWETRHYQLVAARWTYKGLNGLPATFGEKPVL